MHISAISVNLKFLNSKLTIVKILTNSARRLVEPDPELCVTVRCTLQFHGMNWYELALSGKFGRQVKIRLDGFHFDRDLKLLQLTLKAIYHCIFSKNSVKEHSMLLLFQRVLFREIFFFLGNFTETPSDITTTSIQLLSFNWLKPFELFLGTVSQK